MDRSSALVVVLAMACLLVSAAPRPAAAITCGQVVQSLSPCIPYARGGGSIPPGCCTGIKVLNAAATTTPDRRTACTCLKTASASIKGLNPNLVAGIPKMCGVNIPYAISQSTDCTKVK